MKSIKLFLFFIAACISLPLSAAVPLAEKWSGDLMLSPENSLKIVLNFSEQGGEGNFAVSLDSPEQGAYGIPGVVNFLSADSIDIAVPTLAVRYAASVSHSSEGSWAMGNFTQGMLSLPLVLLPGGEKPIRSQTPQPPFPYSTKEVEFLNPEAGNILRGTLTVPANSYEGTPVVLMVSGSGLQNRDEEIFDHKPFAVIADYLARLGIASLRYDDRGCGESSGDGENATTLDFASDAKAGLEYLREKENFGKTGVLGHSEGASIAFILGSGDVKPDFIIGIGSPAVRGDIILEDQFRQSLGETGVSTAMNQARASANPWMRFFLSYDPAQDISGVTCPVLAVFGEKDRQVSPAVNLERFRELLPSATVKVYPGLNHLMQHCETGSPDEYYKIDETVAQEVLSDISRFILQNR